MKLALRTALVLVLIALGALMWSRRDGVSDAAAPNGGSNESAAPRNAELFVPVDPPEPTETPPQVREEVAVAPAVEANPRETLLRVQVVSKERREPLANLRLSLVPNILHGSFTTRDVAGARGMPGENPTTDKDGRAQFSVEPRVAYQLHSSDDRCSHADEHIDALAENETRDIVLELATEDDLVFCGRVVDGASSAALANARVKLGPTDSELLRESFPSEEELRKDALALDSDGRFELRGKSWLMHYAFAIADGYSHVVFVVEKGHETPEHAFEIRLLQAATAEILVRDARGAVSGAKFDLSARSHLFQQGSYMRGYYFLDDLHWSATSDASGTAHLIDLPARVPLKVKLQLPDGKLRQESQPLEFEPGEHRKLEFVIGAGAVVRGRVEDRAGKPIAAWPMWRVAADTNEPRLFRRTDKPAATVLTDADGRFRFDDVPAGAWSIGAAPTGFDATAVRGLQGRGEPADFAGLAQVIEVRDGSEQFDLVLPVDRGLFLRGTVVDPQGRSVTLGSLMAYLTDTRAFFSESIGNGGTFELGPLPVGKWSLCAVDRGGEYAQSEVVQADAGTDGVVLKLRAGHSIRGTVIDARTRAPLPCDVSLQTFDGEYRRWVTGARNAEFKFDTMPAGRYVVSASTDDGRQAHQQVEVKSGSTSESIELALDAGAKLVLRYAGNERWCNFTLLINGEKFDADAIRPGKSEARIVPPGAFEVHWWIESLELQETQSLTLTAGEQREVVWGGKP